MLIPWRIQKWAIALAGALAAIGLPVYVGLALSGKPVHYAAILANLAIIAVAVGTIAIKGWKDA